MTVKSYLTKSLLPLVTNGLKIMNESTLTPRKEFKTYNLKNLKTLELHTYMIAKSKSYNYKDLFLYVIFVYKQDSRVLNIQL